MATAKRRTKKAAKRRPAKKRAAKKRTTKKRATKKRATKKRATKKRATKKRAARKKKSASRRSIFGSTEGSPLVAPGLRPRFFGAFAQFVVTIPLAYLGGVRRWRPSCLAGALAI